MFVTHAFAEQVYCDIFCILGTVFGRTQIHYLTHYFSRSKYKANIRIQPKLLLSE